MQERARVLLIAGDPLALQAANVLSYRAVAAKLDLTHDTVREYIGLLQTVFLIHLLPAWRPGIGAREAHAPKAYLVDAGLLAHLLGADERRIEADDQTTGKVLENFVVAEVLKHADWAATDSSAYHYRRREEVKSKDLDGKVHREQSRACRPLSYPSSSGSLNPTGRFGRAGGEINCLSVLKI